MVLLSESFVVTATSQGRIIRHLCSTPILGKGGGEFCVQIFAVQGNKTGFISSNN